MQFGKLFQKSLKYGRKKNNDVNWKCLSYELKNRHILFSALFLAIFCPYIYQLWLIIIIIIWAEKKNRTENHL